MKRQDVAFLQRVPLVAGLTFFAWSIYGETLMWDPNPESNIAGYRVYYGEASASPAVIDVGNATSRQFSNLEAGRSYFFYVTAYNTEGQESGPSETLNYTKASGGNQPPTVQLTSPSDGATFAAPATITINANATDVDGMVTRVNFYSNGTPIGYDTTSPFSFSMNNVGPGNYELSAQAVDNDSAASASSVVHVSVGAVANQPPTVQLTSPPDGATFAAPATITINANATDPDGTVMRVNFFRNGTLVGNDLTSPFSFTMNNVGPGNYELSAQAVDNDSATSASSIVNVTVGGSQGPVISSIPDQTIQEDSAEATVSFTVRDSDTPATALNLSALSSNTALIANGALIFGGSGTNRTLVFRPQANRFGTARITVRVSDGQSSASTSFDVTVTAVNDIPLISDVPNQSIAIGETTGPLPVTISDLETPSGSLVLTAQSSNTQLVPQSGLVLGGAGGNRTITVRAASNRSGEAVINLTVSDGQRTRSSSFRVTVSGYRVAGTWLNIPLANQTGGFILEFDATPLSGAVDSQLGLSDGPATDFASMATAVRFGPSGSIQARNGLMWGARSFVPYQANAQYHFRMEINLATRLYSIYVRPQGGSEILLGRNYFFRSEQSFVRELNNFAGRTVSGGAVFVDGISIGAAAGGQGLDLLNSLAEMGEAEIVGTTPDDMELKTAASAPQSWTLQAATEVSTSDGLQTYQEVNGATKMNLSFALSWEHLAGAHTIVDFSNADGEPSGFLWYSGGQLRLTHGTASTGAPVLLAAQTQYNIWVDWEMGSGADGAMALYISETGIKPTTALVELGGGTGGAVERIYFGGAAPDSPPLVFEDIDVSATATGVLDLAPY